jgi:hypothetical protein
MQNNLIKRKIKKLMINDYKACVVLSGSQHQLDSTRNKKSIAGFRAKPL